MLKKTKAKLKKHSCQLIVHIDPSPLSLFLECISLLNLELIVQRKFDKFKEEILKENRSALSGLINDNEKLRTEVVNLNNKNKELEKNQLELKSEINTIKTEIEKKDMEVDENQNESQNQNEIALLVSTDRDEITYINARLEDIELLAEGANYKGIIFKDKIRNCSGDNPARQLESGQQRGGQYSCLCRVDSKSHINLELCFKHKACTLEERRQIIMQGKIVSEMLKEKNLNPLRNRKKKDSIDELEDRHVNTHTWGKPRLQQELNVIMYQKVSEVMQSASKM
ncbi:Hypothetical predicted protein [Mytilus galloprovincialis]|uniref:Uncharacterized protein n=1 Tax=Mytilus galloprovincialis TaxID=29158 RepID=A0A8B6ESK1_MYTGA|nr:Hypothetical predicted protein [Mytilus galloprovincialis]